MPYEASNWITNFGVNCIILQAIVEWFNPHLWWTGSSIHF